MLSARALLAVAAAVAAFVDFQIGNLPLRTLPLLPTAHTTIHTYLDPYNCHTTYTYHSAFPAAAVAAALVIRDLHIHTITTHTHLHRPY
jgi:hypothetical protein